KRHWHPLVYKSIGQTCVTVLGLGEIGGYVAERLAQLGFKVNGWSNSPKNIQGVISFTGIAGLSSAVEQTDFIVNVLPLTDATRGILNHEFFSFCPMGTVLLNVGRGAHLVDDDLIEAIDKGQIAGAYL